MNSNCDKSCKIKQYACGKNLMTIESRFPAETPLAMSYVPYQEWEETYKENKALEVGTIFPSLNLPYSQDSGRFNYAK